MSILLFISFSFYYCSQASKSMELDYLMGAFFCFSLSSLVKKSSDEELETSDDIFTFLLFCFFSCKELFFGDADTSLSFIAFFEVCFLFRARDFWMEETLEWGEISIGDAFSESFEWEWVLIDSLFWDEWWWWEWWWEWLWSSSTCSPCECLWDSDSSSFFSIYWWNFSAIFSISIFVMSSLCTTIPALRWAPWPMHFFFFFLAWGLLDAALRAFLS